MKSKLTTFVIVVITFVTIGLCGLIANMWWSSLNPTFQQGLLAIAGAGLFLNCILPIFALIVILAVIATLIWAISYYQARQ